MKLPSRARKANPAGADAKAETFNGYAVDPLLSRSMLRLWSVHSANVDELITEADQAVQTAESSRELKGRFWAYLTRGLLCYEERSLEACRSDLEAARSLLNTVSDARAAKLLAVLDATVVMLCGDYREALKQFSALRLGSDSSADDADDYFVLRGRSTCAAHVGDSETMFRSLYANLLLCEQAGAPVRLCIVAVDLAAALISADRHADAIALLEQQQRKAMPPRENPALWTRFMHCRAMARLHSHAHEAAYADLMTVVHANVTQRNPCHRFLIHNALASACIAMEGWSDAQNHVSLAYEAARGSADSPRLAACHLNAARIAHWSGRTRDAIALLETALSSFESHPLVSTSTAEFADAGALLAQCYAAHGEFEMAYMSHCRFLSMFSQRKEYVARCHIAILRAKQYAGSRIELTSRERDCLAWSAAGKTAWETGKILKVSEWTVVYHLEKAKRKFGLTRKQEVIARAITLGLIADGELPREQS